MKRLLLVVLLLCIPTVAFAQGARITTVVEVGTPYVDKGATMKDWNVQTNAYDIDISGRIVTGGIAGVNTSKLGSYQVTYDGTDESGNAADQAIRTVNVVDTTKPVIVLKGLNPMTIYVGQVYTEPGATATDNYDGDISSKVVITGTVNTATPGANTLTYNVSDISGNAAVTVTRTVNVVIDGVKPIITLIGANPMTVERTGTFTDPGASATDNVDGNISASITKTGSVDTSKVGAYTITYNVKDKAGNAATPVTRTVNVVDTKKPVINIIGSSDISWRINEPYVDQGALAMDDVDGDITSKIVTTANVNWRWFGKYWVRYDVKDAAGNAADTKQRNVTIRLFAA